ncbi:MAG: cupin domain-containing protein [Dehalococcoidia bacterium]|jgi:quercetin dioxygenase-like cupin family protein|nr:cupin domain-containing protein [Dehalococcoidia bacterium]|tara:strand:+ start:1539 stop:1898 length:360 start_codon:yes stop_codon:yes gene_type:complete
MPKAKFVPFDSVEHQKKRPGVLLTSLVDGDTGATLISSGVAEFAVGASAPTHYHDAEESVIVIEGEGLMVINGEEHIVRPNDAAFISPGAHHSIANHGDTSFKISWTYASINWSTTPVE